MYNENNTLGPAEIELISNVSGAYATPFWDGVREVSGALDTVRKIKAVLETLCSTGNELEAYNLILAMYDVIAVKHHCLFPNLHPTRTQSGGSSLSFCSTPTTC